MIKRESPTKRIDLGAKKNISKGGLIQKGTPSKGNGSNQTTSTNTTSSSETQPKPPVQHHPKPDNPNKIDTTNPTETPDTTDQLEKYDQVKNNNTQGSNKPKLNSVLAYSVIAIIVLFLCYKLYQETQG